MSNSGLIRKKKNGLIKVVTGVRQCGKSYLLLNLFHNHLLEAGSYTSPNKLSKTFKGVKNKTISDKTIKNYISYLIASALISYPQTSSL